MNKTQILINEIVEFGLGVQEPAELNPKKIQILLIRLYEQFLTLNEKFDSTEYNEPPILDKRNIRDNVELNFPEFGYYHCLWESNRMDKEADIVTGDAIDDLSDIIKDMIEIKWQFENTSEINALWNFKESMKFHSEQHLVNLLKYLKDKSG